MPSSSGRHKIRVQLWKPLLGADSLRGIFITYSDCKILTLTIYFLLEAFLPTYYDLDSIRSLVLDPAAKAQLQVLFTSTSVLTDGHDCLLFG